MKGRIFCLWKMLWFFPNSWNWIPFLNINNIETWKVIPKKFLTVTNHEYWFPRNFAAELQKLEFLSDTMSFDLHRYLLNGRRIYEGTLQTFLNSDLVLMSQKRFLPVFLELSQASLVKIFQISGRWFLLHPKGYQPHNPEVFFRHIGHGN